MESSFAQVGKVLRTVSRQIKEQAQEFMSNDTRLEKQLKEATANTNWGCSSTILGEIARAANDYPNFCLIMKTAWDAISAKTKYWRKVYKGLCLLEYLVRHGPDTVVNEVRDSLYRLKGLSGFYVTEDGKDKGGGVRDKAKQLVELVTDCQRLTIERETARLNRDRFVGMTAGGEIVAPPGSFSTNIYNSHGYHDSRIYNDLTDINRNDYLSYDSYGNSVNDTREEQRIQLEKENARKSRERRQKERNVKQEHHQTDSITTLKKNQDSSFVNKLSSESQHIGPIIEDGTHPKTLKQLYDFSTDSGWKSTPSVTTIPTTYPIGQSNDLNNSHVSHQLTQSFSHNATHHHAHPTLLPIASTSMDHHTFSRNQQVDHFSSPAFQFSTHSSLPIGAGQESKGHMYQSSVGNINSQPLQHPYQHSMEYSLTTNSSLFNPSEQSIEQQSPSFTGYSYPQTSNRQDYSSQKINSIESNNQLLTNSIGHIYQQQQHSYNNSMIPMNTSTMFHSTPSVQSLLAKNLSCLSDSPNQILRGVSNGSHNPFEN